MIAGIVLFALGLKKTIEDVGDPLATVPAVALCGGLSLYSSATSPSAYGSSIPFGGRRRRGPAGSAPAGWPPASACSP
jgi:hypothetical protein